MVWRAKKRDESAMAFASKVPSAGVWFDWDEAPIYLKRKITP